MPSTPRVLVSLIDEGQDYQHLQGSDARTTAARLGFDVNVVYSKGDTATQLRQIDQAIQAPEGSRPAAVIVQTLSAPAMEPAARAALRIDVGWVCLDPAFYLDSLQRANPGKLVALVTVDGREMGRIQAQIFRALLHRGGSVLHVEGPVLAPSVINRREGMRDGLRGSAIEVIKTLNGDWTEASGEKAATFWLRLGRSARPDLIGAQNDAMASGVRKAIQAWKPEWLDVPITGMDGLPTGGQRMVREGILAATVVQPTTTGAAIELVARARRGERVPPSTTLPSRAFPSVEELQRKARG